MKAKPLTRKDSASRPPKERGPRAPKAPVLTAALKTMLRQTLKRGGGNKSKPFVDKKGNTHTPEFGESGKIIKITVTDPNGVVIQTIERQADGGYIDKRYHPDGTVKSATYTDSDGNIRIYYAHMKDENGHWVTSWTFYDDYVDGAHSRSRTYEETRGRKGKLIRRKEEEYDLTGSSTYVENFDNGEIDTSDYEEFHHGKRTKKIHCSYFRGKATRCKTTWYTPDGKITRERVTRWNDDGSRKSVTTTEYDKDGSSTKTVTAFERDANGAVTDTTVTETQYDSKGNVTGQTSHSFP